MFYLMIRVVGGISGQKSSSTKTLYQTCPPMEIGLCAPTILYAPIYFDSKLRIGSTMEKKRIQTVIRESVYR